MFLIWAQMATITGVRAATGPWRSSDKTRKCSLDAGGLGKLAMHMAIKARPVKALFQHNAWPVAVLWHSGCYNCCNF